MTATTEFTENGLIKKPDVVLIGGGIMSATLGIMLKKLEPKLKIQIVELLSSVAMESSHAWNNAGTGHAALCELNYTPVAVNVAQWTLVRRPKLMNHLKCLSSSGRTL